jgi:membrane associated rhomboid family serine protease
MIPLKDENPIRRFPFVTVFIITLNVLVFSYEIRAGQDLEGLIYRFSIIPQRILKDLELSSLISLFTALFLHAGIWHLLGNMLYLWVFGNSVEDVLGHMKFFIFYLLCGLASSLIHVFSNRDSVIPTLGASGAVSGVLGAYLFLFPRAKILVLIPIFGFLRMVKISAFYFLLFWIFLQFLYGWTMTTIVGSEGPVAWMAHIGGFLSGIILLPFFSYRL